MGINEEINIYYVIMEEYIPYNDTSKEYCDKICAVFADKDVAINYAKKLLLKCRRNKNMSDKYIDTIYVLGMLLVDKQYFDKIEPTLMEDLYAFTVWYKDVNKKII
jgi:hypothetical protein